MVTGPPVDTSDLHLSLQCWVTTTDKWSWMKTLKKSDLRNFKKLYFCCPHGDQVHIYFINKKAVLCIQLANVKWKLDLKLIWARKTYFHWYEYRISIAAMNMRTGVMGWIQSSENTNSWRWASAEERATADK